MFFEILRLCSISQLCAYLSDLVEPLALIVAVIVSLEIFLQYQGSVFIADILRHLVFDPEIVVIEIAYEIENLLSIYQVFTRFVAAAAKIQYLCEIILPAPEQRQ